MRHAAVRPAHGIQRQLIDVHAVKKDRPVRHREKFHLRAGQGRFPLPVCPMIPSVLPAPRKKKYAPSAGLSAPGKVNVKSRTSSFSAAFAQVLRPSGNCWERLSISARRLPEALPRCTILMMRPMDIIGCIISVKNELNATKSPDRNAAGAHQLRTVDDTDHKADAKEKLDQRIEQPGHADHRLIGALGPFV